MIDVSVIIVSYNTRDVTVACIRSVFERTRGCSFEVIVVDNASRDGSSEAIARECPEATLIANSENKGFAGANNDGLAVANGRYLLLLNPDTLVNEGSIRDVLEYCEANPDAGIVGCRCFNEDGSQQSTIFRYPRFRDVVVNVVVPNRLMRKSRLLGRSRYIGADLNQIRDVEVVAGCYMMVRRECYDRVGGMDDRFFMYAEEVDWCFRIHRAGWRIVYFPGASILHYGGLSAATCESQMNLAMAKSNLLLIQKIMGRPLAWVSNALMFLRDTPRVAAWSILKWWLPEGKPARVTLSRAATRWRLHFSSLFKSDYAP